MALLQKPARTPAEIARGRPLDISPTEVASLDEDEWYRRVFRGDEVPQLTLRTVVMGSLLGFLLAFTNLYVGLKTGWGLGVAITACIVSFALWNACLKLGLARTPLSILESNCLQSTASAAGYSTGSTMVSAAPALLMLSVTPQNPAGQQLPWPVLAVWIFFLAMLGVALAVPMKRNMINQERLRFPSGIAAAVTLQSLFSQGREAAAKAKALFYGALVASVPPIIMDLPLRPGDTPGTRKGLVARHLAHFQLVAHPRRQPKDRRCLQRGRVEHPAGEQAGHDRSGRAYRAPHLSVHGRRWFVALLLDRTGWADCGRCAQSGPCLARNRGLGGRAHHDRRGPARPCFPGTHDRPRPAWPGHAWRSASPCRGGSADKLVRRWHVGGHSGRVDPWPPVLWHSLAPGPAGGAADLLPFSGGLPGHRRVRHHAGQRARERSCNSCMACSFRRTQPPTS